MSCKITEINDREFKFKLADLPDGPTFVVSKERVTRYVLANGQTQIIEPGPLKIQRNVSGGRTALKILPMPFFMDHLSLSLEQMLSVGVNLELEAGWINNHFMGGKNFIYEGGLYDKEPSFYYGFYFKPGIKILLGEGFTSNYSKPVHPLKGHYVKLDLAYSYLEYPSISEREFNSYYLYRSVPNFNIRSVSYGALLNYGCQFVFGKRITFEYFAGIGFAWQENKCLNEVVTKYGSYGLTPGNMALISRYGAYYRFPNAGLAGSLGFKLGYIFSKKEEKQAETKAE